MKKFNSERYRILGTELKQFRKANKLTLKQVADKMEVTPKAIQFYEQGVNSIPLQNYIKLCSIYDIQPSHLIKKVFDNAN